MYAGQRPLHRINFGESGAVVTFPQFEKGENNVRRSSSRRDKKSFLPLKYFSPKKDTSNAFTIAEGGKTLGELPRPRKDSGKGEEFHISSLRRLRGTCLPNDVKMETNSP